MSEDVRLLMLEESRRLLVRQETDLDGLRTRSLALFSASAVTAGLFLGRLPKHRSAFASGCLIAGLIAFAATAWATLWITRPHKFVFSHDLKNWIADAKAKDLRLSDWTYNLTRDFNSYRQTNQTTIRSMYKALRVALALMGVQVVAWVLAVF